MAPVLLDGIEVQADLRSLAGPEPFPYILWKMTKPIFPTWCRRWLLQVWYRASNRVERLNWKQTSPMACSPASLIPAALCEGSCFGKQFFADILEKFYSLKSLTSQRKWNFSWANIKCRRNWEFPSIPIGYLVCLCSSLLGVASCSERGEKFCAVMAVCFLLSDL